MFSLTGLYFDIDNFCKEFEPKFNRYLIEDGQRKYFRQSLLSTSEVMTIIVFFHASAYRTFKHYYTKHVMIHMKGEFPDLVSYNRFVELISEVTIHLLFYLQTRKGKVTGISFVDATSLSVCNNRRIYSHKVFKQYAERGKTSVGWFYGFKLHLIINEYGELLSFKITPGDVDDRVPVPSIARNLFGKLFGDRGYISKKLFNELFENGTQLITKIKKNMKNKLMPLMDKILLRKRSIIETVNDQLKNISQIEHTRHRSIANFIVNIISALISYSWQPKKPSLNINLKESLPMSIAF